ncbi:hypothetical protein DIPPA_10872 [Diplonema papillatum]|nr:hypothetical protein DIPPA_10872 [Diplonema papillatum]
MRIRAAFALAAAALGVAAAEDDEVPSVVLGGSLVRENTELNIVRGGETIRLTLTTEGPEGPIRFRPELTTSEHMFNVFLADFAHSPTDSAFIARLPQLVSRLNSTLLDERRTLELKLLPDPSFHLRETEFVYLQVPFAVLDCKCTYRMPVLDRLELVAMEAPEPELLAPPIICMSSFAVASTTASAPRQIVQESYRVEWTVTATAGDPYIENPHAHETRVHGVQEAGFVNISVTFSLGDSRKTASVLVERVASPLPAEVTSPVMHVAGTAAYLNARRVHGGGVKAVGRWTVKHASPDTAIDDETDPNSHISELGERTALQWKVSGHNKCPETTAEVELLTTTARVLQWEDEVCGNEHKVTAEAIKLDRMRGEWSVHLGAADDIHFLPDASKPSVTVIGFSYGRTVLRWTLYGDGESVDYMDVVFVRKHETDAVISTKDPKAYLGSPEVALQAMPPVQGRGEWTVRATTCDPPPAFAKGKLSSSSTVLEGLDHVTEACKVEVQWLVKNPPCPSSVDKLSIAVVPQPPTRPEVGDPIVLCSDGPVKLTGNKAEVGVGLWEAVDPEDQEIVNPSLPKAVLPQVREGRTVVRWTITNGNMSNHADLVIVKHMIAEAKIVKPPTVHAYFCGKFYSIEADNKHFGPDDFGQWTLSDSTGVRLAEYNTRSVDLVDLAPGITYATWTARNRRSMKDCPHGNAAGVVLHSWQFPAEHYHAYTTEPIAVLHIATMLEKASQGDLRFYPQYISELSQLPGEWNIESTTGTTMRIEKPREATTRVTGIPLGVSILSWTPDECKNTKFILRLEHGNRLDCSIYSPGRNNSQGGHTYVIGSKITLSVSQSEFPLAARGAWKAAAFKGGFEHRGGELTSVKFSNPTDASTLVSDLPEGDATISFQISAGVEAFAGECSTVVTSLRAHVPPTEHAVCRDSAEIEATPIDFQVEGLKARWTVPEGSPVTVHRPWSHATRVSNLKPGVNKIYWRLQLHEEWDETPVLVFRDVLPFPFNATSNRLTKHIINMNTLTLPWVQREEWPSSAAEWTVRGRHKVTYRGDTVVLEGIDSGEPAIFQFMVQPVPSSSCAPEQFTLEVVSIATQVTATPILTECDLYQGATMQFELGDGLHWKQNLRDTDFHGLRRSLGEVLGAAFIRGYSPVGLPQILVVEFLPAYLSVDWSAEPLHVKDVKIPRELLAPHVEVEKDAVVLFRHRGGLSPEFTVYPITFALTINGVSSTSEQQLNEDGGLLEIGIQHANTTAFAERLELPGIRSRFIDSITTKSTHSRAYGWTDRKRHLLDGESLAVRRGEQKVSMILVPDEWYTINETESIHTQTPLSIVCGEGEERYDREIRSRDVKIHNTEPRLTVEGAINECDFEWNGANVTVTAVGASFAPGSQVKPYYLKSNSPHLDRGWDAVIAKGLFNWTSVGEGAKRRTLFVHPTGPEVYEIPQKMRETLTLDIPSELLIHSQSSPATLVRAAGSVTIKDTYIEVLNSDICADTLRLAGHTLTLSLHGDAWTPELQHGKFVTDLVGAISGDRHIKNGWETAMVSDVLPKHRYKVIFRSNTTLEVRIPPMPTYTTAEPEAIGIRIPGFTTVCSKCLEHNGLLNVYHSRSMVASNTALLKGETASIQLTLPCARFAVGLTEADVRNSFVSNTRVVHGFDAYRDVIISSVSWINNKTMTVDLRWPSGLNTSVPEEITMRLSPTSVVPTSGQVVELAIPFTIVSPIVKSPQSWLEWIASYWLFFSPAALFAAFWDFMQITSVHRFVDRIGGRLGLNFRAFVYNVMVSQSILFAMHIMDASLWTGSMVRLLYTGFGLIGAALLGMLLYFTDFTRVRLVHDAAFFSYYINICCFFCLGCVFRLAMPSLVAG